MRTFLFYLLLTIALSTYAFHPKDLITASVIELSPCGETLCAILDKDGEHYLVVGVSIGKDFIPVGIYKVIDKKVTLIWSIKWVNI